MIKFKFRVHHWKAQWRGNDEHFTVHVNVFLPFSSELYVRDLRFCGTDSHSTNSNNCHYYYYYYHYYNLHPDDNNNKLHNLSRVIQSVAFAVRVHPLLFRRPSHMVPIHFIVRTLLQPIIIFSIRINIYIYMFILYSHSNSRDDHDFESNCVRKLNVVNLSSHSGCLFEAFPLSVGSVVTLTWDRFDVKEDSARRQLQYCCRELWDAARRQFVVVVGIVSVWRTICRSPWTGSDICSGCRNRMDLYSSIQIKYIQLYQSGGYEMMSFVVRNLTRELGIVKSDSVRTVGVCRVRCGLFMGERILKDCRAPSWSHIDHCAAQLSSSHKTGTLW